MRRAHRRRFRTRRFKRFAKALGVRLRELRRERGWTQRLLAERAGMGVAAIGRLEAGVGNPSLAVLMSVAAAFSLPLAELFSVSSLDH